MALNYRAQYYSKYVTVLKNSSISDADYQHSDSKLIPLLRPWTSQLHRGALCLDLGCGHGNILHALQTLGFEKLYGVDASDEQIVLAHRKFPQVETGDIHEYLSRFSDNYFNLITLFDVVEHLTKDEILTLFTNIYAKLAPSGIFIVHCPNGDSPMASQVFAGDFSHETLLNAKSAESICKLSGFTAFEAQEHLGASSSIKGYARKVLWSIVRYTFRTINLIELGDAASATLTRNFAFKAMKP
jgi:cyclopropane fatty-acyl-phospholipid synthase-like methyltransferase